MSTLPPSSSAPLSSGIGRFATGHWKGILFIVLILCLAGLYAAGNMPSSVFPQTNFPRVKLLVDNGEMPADEMMATITKPIEEAVKDIPGVVNIRSQTSRGSSQIDVFFNWNVDMVQAELFVNSRLQQARSTLPSTVETRVRRLTFSIFPIAGISVRSNTRSLMELWEDANYIIKPKLLRVPDVATVDLVGGRKPEFHVVADPLRVAGLHLGLKEVAEILGKANIVASAGLHEEKDTLYLTLVDGRVAGIEQIEELVVGANEGHPVRVRDFARVEMAPEPANTVVTADGLESVLVMVRSQPYGSTLEIVDQLRQEVEALKKQLPKDVKLTFFYDQSILVRESVRSVWDAILFGLLLSVVILYLFLKDWGSTMVAIVVIPVTVLVTLVAMRLTGMSFNLMTLGGIAAAIGLVIDDAIVVVEAIHTKMATGLPRLQAVHIAIGEILMPLTGSTLTPVVVFLPLAFLNGVPGVFFRALAMTMSVSLLTSLLIAITLTPSLAAWIIRVKPKAPLPAIPLEGPADESLEEGGFIFRHVLAVYSLAVRTALHFRWVTLEICLLLLMGGYVLYGRLESEFLPKMDEGGVVIDYVGVPGTSLAEVNRALLDLEGYLLSNPDIEAFSRRTGTSLNEEVNESNTGDFLVKFKSDRTKTTEDIVAELRAEFLKRQPQFEWEFPGIVADLINDLTWSPEPIEIKLFSEDMDYLKRTAPEVEKTIAGIKGIVDTKDGLVIAGSSLNFRVRSADAQRYGLTTSAIAEAVEAAKLGALASSVLQEDRVIGVRVLLEPSSIDRIDSFKNLPLKTAEGQTVLLSQVADVEEQAGELELMRENLRQYVAVAAGLEKLDLGSGVEAIKAKLAKEMNFPAGVLEYGGLYKQQQESFHNLLMVLITAILLVFTVLLLEFKSFLEPIAIVAGAVLALIGAVAALWLTGTSENIISLLGAIIGVGIVAKNGILMLDFVAHLRDSGLSLEEALVRSGRRRLRPVLMTSMAAALGMLPLAYGVGSGADMLRPLAIAVIGALCVSVLLSLVATPAVYYLMMRLIGQK
jgi:CzcA family heavy metal efflux pump